MYSLNYGSTVQQEMQQDIERTEFQDLIKLRLYLIERLDFQEDVVFTVQIEWKHLNPSHEEFPSALVCRQQREIISYIGKLWFGDDPFDLFIFEWDSYEDAINYLHDSMQTSSKYYSK
jgi:hypothetical protein